jgi:U3 small nucleolar RNA-associated protein 20
LFSFIYFETEGKEKNPLLTGRDGLDLKQTAQEILSLLQGKIGTTEYARAYTRVKGVVMERRQERRSKRRIEVVAEPEVAARRKTRKHERKREVRKEKGREMRDFRRGKAS